MEHLISIYLKLFRQFLTAAGSLTGAVCVIRPKLCHRLNLFIQPKLASIIGQKNRVPNEPVVQFHQDLASSTQAVMEECLISVAEALKVKKARV